MVKFVLIFIVYGLLMGLIGWISGWRNGRIQGMKEFLSVIKVYDTEGVILNLMNEMFGKVTKLSQEERQKIFKDYVEKYLGPAAND